MCSCTCTSQDESFLSFTNPQSWKAIQTSIQTNKFSQTIYSELSCFLFVSPRDVQSPLTTGTPTEGECQGREEHSCLNGNHHQGIEDSNDV